MKTGIHPDNYRMVLFYDSSADTGWLIRSCAPTNQTREWTDGNSYPVFYVDTSSASHPAYTGKQRLRRSAHTKCKHGCRDGYQGHIALLIYAAEDEEPNRNV